jgi:hypothetical protein
MDGALLDPSEPFNVPRHVIVVSSLSEVPYVGPLQQQVIDYVGLASSTALHTVALSGDQISRGQV